MKPLFLTFSNSREPYPTLVKRLQNCVERFDVGDFKHININIPWIGANFYTVSACLLYSYIIRAINLRSLIVLDCDNEIKKSLPDIFDDDWDLAACYRGPRKNSTGRQDYNGGLIALNNKRPDVIRKFWVEWINKTELLEKTFWFFPETLKADGWRPSWYSDQSALNQIILPENDSYKIIPGESYISHGYKIMPLNQVLYGAQPGKETGDTFIMHHKGDMKRR